MKKENVYVEVKSNEKADFAKHLLQLKGEKISTDGYFQLYESEMILTTAEDGEWCLFHRMHSVKNRKECVSFGQLIDLLNEPVKIAIKVENEKEFKALMKYYASLGWNWASGIKALEYPISYWYGLKCIPYHDRFDNGLEDKKIDQGYQIIPFTDFAKEHNIKLPIHTSVDGVDLFFEDRYFAVYADRLWRDVHQQIMTCGQECVINPERAKAFSTKQAALDWIEAQKPKFKTVPLFIDGLFAEVYGGEILIKFDGKTLTSMMPSDIEDIHHAIKG